MAGPIHIVHQQSGPAEISVEGKLRTTRLIKSDSPQNCHLILLIECVSRTNEDETPVLLLGMMLKQE